MGYFLKLYTDILDDPKYFRLSEEAKTGMYEIFLVAKKIETGTESTGELPSLEDIAFHTRRDVEWWKNVMVELVSAEIVDADQQMIRKFKERQAKISDAERMKQYRKRKNDSTFTDQNTDVTEALLNVMESKSKSKSKSREREEDKEFSSQQFISDFISAARVQFTNQNQPDQLKDLVDDYGEELVLSAAKWYGDKSPSNMGHALKSIDTALRRGWNVQKDKNNRQEILDYLEAQ